MCPPGGTWLYCDKKFGEFVQSANSPNIFLNSCSKMPGGASPSPTVLTELSAYFATRPPFYPSSRRTQPLPQTVWISFLSKPASIFRRR